MHTYKYTGYLHEIKRYVVQDDIPDGYISVAFSRKLDDGSFEEWKSKRMTGFAMQWYFLNISGHVVDGTPDAMYTTERRNKEFFRMIHILQAGETVDNVWGAVKKVRKDWLGVEQDRAVSYCSYGIVQYKIVGGFLDDLETMLNMTEVTGQENKEGVTGLELELAAEMYIYMVTCPTVVTLAWRQFYTDLFKNFPERFILETLAHLSKTQQGENKSRNIPQDLIASLDSIFHFNVEKTALAMETESTFLTKLKEGKIKKYKAELENCLHKNNCEEIDQLIRSLGR